MALALGHLVGHPVPTPLPACPELAEGREEGVNPLSLWERVRVRVRGCQHANAHK